MTFKKFSRIILWGIVAIFLICIFVKYCNSGSDSPPPKDAVKKTVGQAVREVKKETDSSEYWKQDALRKQQATNLSEGVRRALISQLSSIKARYADLQAQLNLPDPDVFRDAKDYLPICDSIVGQFNQYIVKSEKAQVECDHTVDSLNGAIDSERRSISKLESAVSIYHDALTKVDSLHDAAMKARGSKIKVYFGPMATYNKYTGELSPGATGAFQFGKVIVFGSASLTSDKVTYAGGALFKINARRK